MNIDLKEERSHKDVWGKIIPGRGNSRCKGPVVGTCQVLFKMLDTQWWIRWMQCYLQGAHIIMGGRETEKLIYNTLPGDKQARG